MNPSLSLGDQNVAEAALIPLNLGRPLFDEMHVLRGPITFNIGNSVVGSGGVGGKNWVRVERDSSKGNWWIQEMTVYKETLVANKNSVGDPIWISLKDQKQICLFGLYHFVFVQNLQKALFGTRTQLSIGQLSQQNQEVPQEYGKTIEQLEKEMTCSICMEMFIEPVLYRCGHIFCSKCIVEWKQKSPTRIVLCPLCLQELQLPPSEFKYNTIMCKNLILLMKQVVEHNKMMIMLTAQEVTNCVPTCQASIAIPSTSNVSASSGRVPIILDSSDSQSIQQPNNDIEVIDIDDDDSIANTNSISSSEPDEDEIVWLDDPAVVAQHLPQQQYLRPRRFVRKFVFRERLAITTETGMH